MKFLTFSKKKKNFTYLLLLFPFLILVMKINSAFCAFQDNVDISSQQTTSSTDVAITFTDENENEVYGNFVPNQFYYVTIKNISLKPISYNLLRGYFLDGSYIDVEKNEFTKYLKVNLTPLDVTSEITKISSSRDLFRTFDSNEFLTSTNLLPNQSDTFVFMINTDRIAQNEDIQAEIVNSGITDSIIGFCVKAYSISKDNVVIND